MDRITITPLGTSAGTPTRERNVASVLMQLDGTALLFDCGEGTQYRLLHTGWRPNAIEAILITHLHGDHLFGLPGLLATMSMLNRERRLTIVGPRGIIAFLDAIRSSSQLTLNYDLELIEAESGIAYQSKEFDVRCEAVEHSVPCIAFAVIEHASRGKFNVARAVELGVPEGPMFSALQNGESVTLGGGRVVRSYEVLGAPRPGRRVVYCTDTRPCASAVEISRNADVLIHEATYGDEMAAEAIERFHSTARQAAEIAAAASVRQLMITHFSPRYDDIEVLVGQARDVFKATIGARELEPFPVSRHVEEGL